MSSNEEQQLLACIKSLQEQSNKAMTFEEFLTYKQQLDEHFTALAVLQNPKLKGQDCPLCKKKFDGYGNNPAPLKVKGSVCDTCNSTKVIPARLGK